MESVFLSLVFVIDDAADRRELLQQLPALHEVVAAGYKDFEYVVINNLPEWRDSTDFAALAPELRPYVYLINLSSRTNRNHAWLAGLDRANGDYTLLLERQFLAQPDLIGQLYTKSQEGYDLVYLKAARNNGRSFGWMHRCFHWVIRRFSKLRIDPLAHHSRIISRRALNALLRLRENLPYLKAAYSLIGFNATSLVTPQPLPAEDSFGERFRAGLQTISSYTTFLRALMGWIFVGSFLFLLAVVANALLVRFAGMDLFGQEVEAVSGWTYLVVLIGVFFATVSLQLYLMSIYLGNIYEEIKRRPLYTIESIRRF